MGAGSDGLADHVEVGLHRLGLDVGHGKPRPDAAGRADGPEEVGALIALVSWLSRPCPASGPLTHQAILLTDPGLILEPDLDRPVARQASQMRLQGFGEVFLYAAITSGFRPGCRRRALMWEKPRSFSTLPIVRSWYTTPKRSAISFCRSTRRQRTTP